MSLPKNNAIDGVIFKSLRTFPDDRGFFREVVRVTDDFFEPNGFAQWSHSRMTKDVVKAWHFHHQQIDWWYLGVGQIETVLYDNRPESPTYRQKLVFRMGESRFEDTHEVCVRIPQGVLHGCRVLSDDAHLFYITSCTYNPADEGRLPYNTPDVPHNWGQGAITNEKDRVHFMPPHPRVR